MMRRMMNFIFILLLINSFCLSAYAKSNADSIKIEAYNFTNDAYYIELLIQMNNNDKFYTAMNEDNMNRYNFDKKELINYYDNDGYISYSCHYKNVYTIMNIKKVSINDKAISENLFTLNESLGRDIYIMKDLYENKRKFKIAVLDESGKIIQISKSFELINSKNGYIASGIEYNIADNEYSFEWSRDDYSNVISFKITNKPLFISVLIFLISSISFLIYSSYKRKN